MTYETPRDPRIDANDPVALRRPSASFGGWLPLVLSIAVVAAVLAMFYPSTTTERVNDTTNTGPSVQTVTPAPSPTTEPRPTQAPQP